ncbi:AMP-binding enzyme, putative [Coleofasciculus chthonoplastes PCC 7420]|uniref:AMP-binding enzyme, putative n=1 Tax=Coleofasciculus chthonoplastes PCC 7420 TaxID=118168 RepID=B4VZ61_9CYAN|nr:2-succinylbenzoate--CoA ligase [Coleofasciculus chthonoplastes]EDX72916.1 AMP-binding enzyme, putative [Coleofasciculus chthonoplastes PCC 7420]
MNSILIDIKQRNNDWLIGFENKQFQEINHKLFAQFSNLSLGQTVPKIILAESNPWRFLAALSAAIAADCSVVLGNPNWTQPEWQQVLALVQPDLIWGDLSPVIRQESFVKNKGQGIVKTEPTMGVTELGVCSQRFSADSTKVPTTSADSTKVPTTNADSTKVPTTNADSTKVPTTNADSTKVPTTNADSTKVLTTNPKIMIPTGGSSGKIRFVMHSWDTLMASVRGFHQYFDQKPVNSFCVLPVYHVSGLMQFLRSLTTGGQFASLPFRDVVAGKGRDIDPRDFFISLVPTQLQRLLRANAANWLSQFHTVLLGGAPAYESLLTEARQQGIRLAPTYGMTETASQVVTLKPDAFLAGNNSCGQVLPHAHVTICSTTGEFLGTNQIGIVTIAAESLALGYYSSGDKEDGELTQNHVPIRAGVEETLSSTTGANFQTSPLQRNNGVSLHFPNPQSPIPNSHATPDKIPTLQSDDLGFFDDQGYLTIVGRHSHKIISGGENIFPAEVEAAILATQLVRDVCVIGIPHNYWGQAVTAVYVPRASDVSVDSLKAALVNQLSRFKQPKYWVPVEQLPRNEQGKVNYESVRTTALEFLPMV